MTAELDIRYPADGMALFEGLDSLNSKSAKYLDIQCLQKLFEHYGRKFHGVNPNPS